MKLKVMKVKVVPRECEAVQVTKDNLTEIMKWSEGCVALGSAEHNWALLITPELYPRVVTLGDWIIKDKYGKCRLCDQKTLERDYIFQGTAVTEELTIKCGNCGQVWHEPDYRPNKSFFSAKWCICPRCKSTEHFTIT